MNITLGTLTLQSHFLLSPMEEVSDVAFRKLCFDLGAGITWTEMIRAKGILRKNKATLDLIDTYDPQTLTGLQIFSANEKELLAALTTLEELANSTHPHFKNIRAIDLNFGCPSPNVIRIGAGPALIKRATKMELLFSTLAQWRKETTLPIGAISAKIRLGLNQREMEHKVYLRLIDAANLHLDFLTVHARHAKQRSRDPPTWSAIREIKERATIPIIGNGGVCTVADAERMFAETGCDGIMLANAAIADPWIFRVLSGGKKVNQNEIIQAQLEYTAMAKQYGTKEKYVAFHLKNFVKMITVSEGI